MIATDSASRPASPLTVVALAATIGLGYGIFEGTESYILSLLPAGLSWYNGNSIDALRYLPPLYCLVYLGIGAAVAVLAMALRRPWWDQVIVFGLMALSGYLAARNQGRVFSILASAMLGLGLGTIALRIYRKRLRRGTARAYRSLAIAGVIALLVGAGSAAAARLMESRRLARLPTPAVWRPNVLLIVLDTQRADHISAYGYSRPTTPRIDSLAAEGMLFERAFSPSSWTLTSHASLFTGRPLHQHQAGNGTLRILEDRLPTLAERLGQAGYATAGFVANTFWAARHTGLARGFVHYEDYYGTLGDAFQRMTLFREMQRLTELMGAVDISGRKRASHVTGDFLRWQDGVEGRPFFAFLNYMDVHAPYLPPPGFLGTFGPLRPEFRPRKLELDNRVRAMPSSDELAYRIDRYDESLRYLDEHVGRLVAELRRRGKLDSTIVVITADHGELFGEHGFLEHGKSLYRQETMVPLIIRYPPAIAPARVPWPVTTMRVAATISDIIGIDDGVFPGPSFLKPDDRLPVLMEMGRTGVRGTPAEDGWVRSLVSDNWQFILRQSGGQELYNLTEDWQEERDVATTQAGMVVAARLRTELERLTGAVTTAGRSREEDARP